MAGLLTTLAGVWLAQVGTRRFQAPLAIAFEDQATADVYQLLDTPAFEGKQVLFGPSHQFTGTWLFRHRVVFRPLPPRLPAPDFLGWIQQKGIDYILADKHMIQRRRDTVREYLAYDSAEGVKLVRAEPGWEVLYQGPPPSKFILLRVR